jgi:hypothetical protein
MGNVSLARMDPKVDPESANSLRDAEKAVVRAKDLTQQLLTFAKGGAPIRTAVALPDVLREVAEFALRGSRSRCQFDLPDDLWPGQREQNDGYFCVHQDLTASTASWIRAGMWRKASWICGR